LTDIHLLGRQDEGIEGKDPARDGRFAAGEHVDTNGCNNGKRRSFIGIHSIIHNYTTMHNLPRQLISKMMKIYE
jgi:hypothetical protein